MAHGDGAAIDIDLVVTDVELVHGEQHDGGERLVDFEQVDVGNRHAGARQHLLGHRNRAGQHDRRLGADIGKRPDPGARLEAGAFTGSALPIKVAAAPSTMPEELPA